MTAAASTACALAADILTNPAIDRACSGITIDERSAVTINLADVDVLRQAAVNLGLRQHGSFVDRFSGVIAGIPVALRLHIPYGIISGRAA